MLKSELTGKGITLKFKYLLLVFGIANIVYLFFVGLNQRDYQDSWILQDIFVPTILYVLTFVVVAVKSNDNRLLVFVCSAFIITLNAIPNLKYTLFQNVFDTAAHYGFASQILSTGFVPTTGLISLQYSSFPGMHIFLTTVSSVFGINMVLSVKFVSSVIYGILPFLFYFATNIILDKRIQKYVILCSALPVTIQPLELVGSTFAIPFFVAFFCILFRITVPSISDRKLALLSVIIGVGLLFSHAATITTLVLFLPVAFLLLKIYDFLRKETLNSYFLRTSAVIWAIISLSWLAWLIIKAPDLFSFFIQTAKSYILELTAGTSVPPAFFGVPFLDKLRFLALHNGSDILFFTLALAGLAILLKTPSLRNRNLLKKSYPLLLSLSVVLLSVVGFDLITGRNEYPRFLYDALALSPLLVGLLFWAIDERFRTIMKRTWFRKVVLIAVVFSITLISFIQMFPYQPWVPTANVLSNDLPASEYIFDFQKVNTIYQVDMIHFADKYSSNETYFVSDRATLWQIVAFASPSFQNRQIWPSPLEFNLTELGIKWDLCLLHYDGKAGSLNEPVQNRTRQVVDEFRTTSGNTIYDNGESFIMSR